MDSSELIKQAERAFNVGSVDEAQALALIAIANTLEFWRVIWFDKEA